MSNEFLRRMIEPDVIDWDRPSQSNYVPPKQVVHIWLDADAQPGEFPLCGEANASSHLCPAFSNTVVILPFLATRCYCHMPVCSFCLLLWEGLPR